MAILEKYGFLLSIILAFTQANLQAQQFEFSLYFEDAIGNRDTVVLGLDTAASYGLDSAFGEIDISHIPYDSVFEVRGATYDYPLECRTRNNREQLAFESKKLITHNTCDYPAQMEFQSAMITIKAKYKPITILWDSSLFVSQCSQSYLVDLTPGGWFDACCCHGTTNYPVDLKSQSSFTFSSTDFQFLMEEDSILTLFVPLTKNGIYGIHQLNSEGNFKLYPNPMTGKALLIIDNPEAKPHRLKIFNSAGKLATETEATRNSTIEFNMKGFAAGSYYYQLLDSRGKAIGSGKFQLYDEE